MDQNVVSSLIWIKKGFAKKNPKEFELNEEQIKQMKNDPLVQKNLKKELGQEDENISDEEEENLPVFTQDINMLKYDDNIDQNGDPIAFDEMSDEEKEDFNIRPTDALIVAAKIEKEFSSLEIYVYEEDKNNLFVHHEIQLSAFPLSLEWLRVAPSSFEQQTQIQGNYAIVGSFLPEIEIWNLDVLNVIEPDFVLGGEMEISNKKVKKFKNKKQLKPGSHSEGVMSLNLNTFRQNILASGSADKTVKIWDLSTQQNMHTYNHHKGEVQVVQWNKKEETILLTGGYDKQLFMFDARTPENALSTKISDLIESAVWDPINSNQIVYATQDGYVSCIDARKFNLEYIYHFKAHSKTTTSVSASWAVPGLLATTSEDHYVKIWDTNTISNKQPLLVCQKNPNAGKLFCGSFYEDSPWIFACGNSKGEIFVWDITEDKFIVQKFGDRVDQKYKPDINLCTQNGQKNLFTKEKESSDDDIEEEQNMQEEQK